MELLSHPATLFTACVATLVGALLLFFSLKRELAAIEARRNAETEARAGELSRLERRIVQLEQELEEERKNALARAAPPGQSMNLSKRSQALRMYRLGEPLDRIAQALGLSRGEVELLVKVHRTVLESIEAAPAARQ